MGDLGLGVGASIGHCMNVGCGVWVVWGRYGGRCGGGYVGFRYRIIKERNEEVCYKSVRRTVRFYGKLQRINEID